MPNRFSINVSAGLLDGAMGVSPAVGDNASLFVQAFTDRWDERPSVSAVFFYDAAAVLALAIEQPPAHQLGRAPSSLEIRDQIPAVANPPERSFIGTSSTKVCAPHGKVETSTTSARSSGAVDFDSDGAVVESRIQLWHVAGNAIVDDDVKIIQ